MKKEFKFCLAQINFTVGDIEGNFNKILQAYQQAVEQQSSFLITSELALTGYPPEDLVFKKSLVEKVNYYRNTLAQLTTGKNCAIILGCIYENKHKLYNSAFILADGKSKAIVNKHHLPNYGVFDEKRLFAQGKIASPINYKGIKLGIMICEDGWFPEVPENLHKKSAHIYISINASPFDKNKFATRLEIAQKICTKYHKPFIYLNQVGGQDGIIFDGGSFVLNSQGKVISQANFFAEDNICVSIKKDKEIIANKQNKISVPSSSELIYQAMVLGLKDYTKKNNFDKLIIGLSGGIDSAIVATIAADALGAKKVHSIILPSRYTSQQSLDDAITLAKKLAIPYEIISIEDMFVTLQKTIYCTKLSDYTLENAQARIRSIILMAISNEIGGLLLNTSNKSEHATGYTTLYGDSCGGYAPIKDLYKTELYLLAKWRNKHIPHNSLNKKSQIIHNNILVKPPTAELRYNQTDQDTLPPYEVLDPILYHLIEENLSKQDIINKGFNKSTVEEAIRMLHTSEFKRRQSPPGTKISTMYFNVDRRYPITNKFVE